MKRWTAAALALFLFCCAFAVAEETRRFVDSTGREIDLPERIERVAVTGPLAQYVVFALAPELLAGTAVEWGGAAEGIIPDEYLDLPVLGQLYGGRGNLNLETLLGANPDVLIDVGEDDAALAADMDELSEKTGIPCIHVDIELNTIPGAFRMLGELLDRQTEAEARAAYAENVLERTRRIAGSVEKARIMYVLGSEGLNVIARDSYHSEVLDLLGENVAVVDAPSSKGTGNEVDMEQMLIWDPDFIVFAPGSVCDTVADSQLWQAVSAIRNENFCEAPEQPVNWMGFPPSVQRLMGMTWLAKVLYPQEADYDLFEETKTFFDLFYHCELTEETYASVMEKSFF